MANAKKHGDSKADQKRVAPLDGRLPLTEFLISLDLDGLDLTRERDTGRDREEMNFSRNLQ